MWVAPNLLTITGWLFILSDFLLLSYYDWDVMATTSDGVSLVNPPIPRWVWFYCCLGHFVGYALDGIDGKQARRTGSSTPVGQFLIQQHLMNLRQDSLCSHPLTRAALPPVPTGVHETPGAQRAMVARKLLMLTEIIEQSESITIWHLRCILS